MLRLSPPAIVLAVVVTVSSTAAADTEASNIAYVTSGTWGRCYAKAVPDDYFGERGVTRVFEVGADADTQTDAYDWYSRRVYLQCNMSRGGDIGASLVRFGRWPLGQRASADQLAFAFYFKGEELARYSTLDIAGSPDNVEMSASHYQVIGEVKGYRWRGGNDYAFDVVTIDGRLLSFDPLTGARLD